MDKDDKPLLESNYRGVEIQMVEAPDDSQLIITSHKPFSSAYTVAIPHNIVVALAQSHMLGPYLMSLASVVHIMVNIDLEENL